MELREVGAALSGDAVLVRLSLALGLGSEVPAKQQKLNNRKTEVLSYDKDRLTEFRCL